jgi:putative phosphoribosyl transferase
MKAFMEPAGLRVYGNRLEAGRELAKELAPYRWNAVVVGIPRGGVVTAAEVARALGADLDVIVAKKIGAPGQPELAIGAVAADGVTFLNEELIGYLGVPQAYLNAMTEVKRKEAQERERVLRGAGRRSWSGRNVILVDDGLATGATMRAAVRAVRRQHPANVVVAVPVGSTEACNALRLEADAVVCPIERADFGAVGAYYQRFDQVSDDEVRRLLEEPALSAGTAT